MLNLRTVYDDRADKRKRLRKKPRKSNQYKKLTSMGRVSAGIINELYSPIDSINRFINLALQTLGEDSQSRQFLLESKQGIRKTSRLLKKLNNYAKKIEKEFLEISDRNEQGTNINRK